MLTKLFKISLPICFFFLLSSMFFSVSNNSKPGGQGTSHDNFFAQFTDFVPCTNGGNGELIAFEGNIQINSHYSTDKRGGVHARFQVIYQGVSGTGLSTGLQYQTPGPSMEKVFYVDGETDKIYHFTLVYKIIGQGPGNNFNLHSNFAYVIQDGELKVVHGNDEVSCN